MSRRRPLAVTLWMIGMLVGLPAVAWAQAEPKPPPPAAPVAEEDAVNTGLANLAKDKYADLDERLNAAKSLGKRKGPKAKDGVPALLEFLAELNLPVHRVAVIDALGSLGPAAEDAVPALVAEVRNTDPDIVETRLAAADALAKIGSTKAVADLRIVEESAASEGLRKAAAAAVETLKKKKP